MTTRYCPDCGEPIEFPDDLELPAGAVVRHEPGECPKGERAPQYLYRVTFRATRMEMTDSDIGPIGLEGTEETLAMVSEEMVAPDFTAVAFELSKRIGEKWNLVLQKTNLIDKE